MSDTPDLADLEHRAQHYWTADGLPELVMGLLWVVWGISWLVGESLPRGPVWNVYWMFTPVLLALSGVAAVWVTKRLKAAITFPRGGYVEWREPTRGRRLTAAAVSLVTACLLVLALTSSRARGFESMAAPALGVLFSLAFVVASRSQKAPHLLALAGVALILGLTLSRWTTGYDGLNWMLIGLGTAAALLGAVRLWWFLKNHPVERRA